MTKLQITQSRLAKAETVFEQFTPEHMEEYKKLLDTEYFLRMGKMFVGSAPQSMNPRKCSEHFKQVYRFLSSRVEKEQLDAAVYEVFKTSEYKPQHVQDYRTKLLALFGKISENVI